MRQHHRPAAPHRPPAAPLPFDSFDDAARSVLARLQDRHGMGLWMFTRTVDDDWIALVTEDHGYDVTDGTVFRWSDSFCSRMVRGEGPRAAPRSADVPTYVAAEIGRQVPIGAYVGVPLHTGDGDLFGTLCAIDPQPRADDLADAAADAELLGRLLMTVLEAERRADADRREAERERIAARTDALCGIANRRAWDDVLAAEEARCRRYGDPAGIVVVDLDGLKERNDTEGHDAGDRLLAAAGRALVEGIRDVDVVARTGGDEFAVLATGITDAELAALTDRVRRSLAAAGVAASVGCAERNPRRDLADAWHRADAAMYADKQHRNAGRDWAGRDGAGQDGEADLSPLRSG